MPYLRAYPHDPIEELIPDVFMVRGTFPMGRLLRISRNMAIVRHQGELTLVNPIRLSAAGEAQLRDLGEVRRLLRLGPFHGCDDAYYVDTFSVELWATGRSRTYPHPEPSRIVGPDDALPFPKAQLVSLPHTKQPESVLLIRREGGLLLTCDSIQSYGDYRHNNLPARLMMPFIGFPKRTLVGPMWLKFMTPEGGSLEGDFRALLDLEFERLLSAHGAPVLEGARDAVADAVDRAFAGQECAR